MKPSAEIKTNNQARAALGVAATWLRQGFIIVDNQIKTSNPLDKGEFARLRISSRDALTRTNKFAQAVYKTLPANDLPITPTNLKRVAVAIDHAAKDLGAIKGVNTDLQMGFLDAVVVAVQAAAKAVAEHPVLAASGLGVMLLGAWLLLGRRK